jgi:hypothetical protein
MTSCLNQKSTAQTAAYNGSHTAKDLKIVFSEIRYRIMCRKDFDPMVKSLSNWTKVIMTHTRKREKLILQK